MGTMKKTPAGTLAAYPYEQDGCTGIAVGFYDRETKRTRGVVFLEVDAEGNVSAIVDGKTCGKVVTEQI